MCNTIYIYRNALDFWPLVLLPVYKDSLDLLPNKIFVDLPAKVIFFIGTKT